MFTEWFVDVKLECKVNAIDLCIKKVEIVEYRGRFDQARSGSQHIYPHMGSDLIPSRLVWLVTMSRRHAHRRHSLDASLQS